MEDQNITLQDLAKLINSIRDELSGQINSMHLRLEEKIATEISGVKKDIANLYDRQVIVEDKLEKIERHLHLTDLLLHGIPKIDDEHLNDVMSQICNKIGFQSMEWTLVAVFQINSKSNKPPIVLKFISSNARSQFFNFYFDALKIKPLLLKDIGLRGNDRIFIQESLSPSNAALFRKSMELKHKNFIHNVHTKNGFVKIKVSQTDKAIAVSSLQQLLDIEHDNDDKLVTNKRKINNSSKSNNSFVENETKILKTNNPGIHSSTLMDLTDNESILHSTPTTTIINNPLRKMSTGTLDEFVTRGVPNNV